MKRFALLVACDDYPKPDTLHCCANDARLLRDTLTELCDYNPQDVTTLILSLENPCRPQEILDSLSDLVSKSQPDDTILFYFAGHGHGLDGDAWLLHPNFSENEGRLSIREISSILKAQDRLCIRIFDACHSGLDIRTRALRAFDSEEFTRAIEEESSHRNWVTFASCRHQESSIEDISLNHGIFTYALVDSIRSIKEGSLIRPQSLSEMINEKVSELARARGHDQNPVFNCSLSGKVSIATRIQQTSPQQEEVLVETRDLHERLNQERERKAEMVIHRSNEVDAITAYAEAALIGSCSKFGEWKIEANVKSGDANIVPERFKRPLVEFFNSLGVQSHISFVKEPKQDSLNVISIISSLSSQREYSYEIYGWFGHQTKLASVLNWHGDSYLPGGEVLFFAIPLETQLYVVVWGQVDSFLTDKQRVQSYFSQFMKLDADYKPIIKDAIEWAVSKCVCSISDSVSAKLDYLDRERKRE